MSTTTPLRTFGRKDPPAPLPNSKSTYEPPLKRELANRLFLICSASFGLMWPISLIMTMDFIRGPPLGLLGHLVATSLVATFALMVGAVPPLVLRGRAVSEKYTLFPTRAETFMALLFSARVWRTLAYFAASGFSLALLHVTLINFSEWEDSRLSILSPTRRNPFRLNERVVYLAFFNASLGLVFAARDLIRQRQIVRWPRVDAFDAQTPFYISSPTTIEALLAMLNIRALISTTVITLIHVFVFPVWYHLLRALALPILRSLPWLSGLTRPMLHAFGRTWIVDIPWYRLLALGFKTSLSWELVESAFDHWVTKPIAISPKASSPNEILVAGLHSQDHYFKHHAYVELSALACSPSPAASARRTALFTDTKTSPTLWNAVVRELLITLGQDYQCLLRRGKPPPPAPVPAPSTPKTPKAQPTPLIRQAILKPSPRPMLDSLASDGEVTQALTSIATLPESVRVPSVFLPVTPTTPRIAKEAVHAVEAKTSVVSQKVVSKAMPVAQMIRAGRKAVVLGILCWVEAKFPRQWRLKEWWTDASIERQARACVPEGSLDAVGIEALSHLVAASLKEDTLGTVQRDIPRILEALLSFLAEAEAYQAELENKHPLATHRLQDGSASKEEVEAAQDVARAIEVVLTVVHALRTGVGLIAKTFGDRLGVYRFPPPTAKRLQSFMDCL